MIVADSSVWVAYLRADGTDAHQRFVQLRDEADLAVTEMLVLEVLAGARDEPDRAQLRDQLLAFPLLTLDGLDAFEEAARIFQTCRRRGETPRKLADCLIAVPCIRADALLVHADRDFEVIARCTTLRTESLLP